MRLTLHGGADEIGGNAVELEAGGQRIALDLGLPLDSQSSAKRRPFPNIAGLHYNSNPPRPLGVFLSHIHLDHYGFLPGVCRTIPTWISNGSQTMLAGGAASARSGRNF